MYFEKGQKDEGVFWTYLTGLYIVTWFLQLGIRVEILYAIRFEMLLGLTLGVAALKRLASDKQKSSGLTAPIVVWMVVLSIYTIFSFDITTSWNVFLNRVIKFSMLALYLYAFIRTEKEMKIVLAAFILAMLKLGQEGFFGWLTGGLVWENQGIMRLHGSVPLYEHPNSFSGMAIGCLPFVFYLLPLVTLRIKAILLVLAFFCGVIILYSGSRTGYVATLFLTLMFYREKLKASWAKYTMIGVVVVIATISFIPEQYLERFESIYTHKEAQGASTSARILIIADAIEIFFEHPLGVGVSAFPFVRMETFGRFQDTHNMYLELLTNLSFLGVFSFFWFVFRLLKINKNIAGQKLASPLSVAVSKIVIAYIYARLILGLFGMDTYEIYWWFAAGLTAANYRLTHSMISQKTTVDATVPAKY